MPTWNKSSLTVGAAQLTTAGAALAMFGYIAFSGNTISTREYTVANLINNTYAVNLLSQTGSTATGGLKSGGTQGNYQAVTINSPFASGNTNGVSSGTGVLNYAQIDLVAPQSGGAITCSIANVTTRGTGGTIVIPRTVMATGAIVLRSTGSFIIGPTESFRCSVNDVPSAAFSAKALLKLTESRVAN